MIKHNHTFVYNLSESNVPEVTPQIITMQLDGDLSLPQILDCFEKYLIAVGYVPPDNSYLDFVARD